MGTLDTSSGTYDNYFCLISNFSSYFSSSSSPSTVSAYSEADIASNLKSDTTIELQANVTLPAGGGTSSAFVISGVVNLVINGNGHSIRFASSSSSNGRFFYIDSYSDVEINDLTLENGYVYGASDDDGGGAIYSSMSYLVMNGCELSNNKASHFSGYLNGALGGAVFVISSSAPFYATFSSCVFSRNTVANGNNWDAASGGAAYISSSEVAFSSCLFYRSSAYVTAGYGYAYGGAVHITGASTAVACSGTYFAASFGGHVPGSDGNWGSSAEDVYIY